MKFKAAIVLVLFAFFSCQNPVTSSAPAVSKPNNPVTLPGPPAALNSELTAPVRYSSLVSNNRSAQGQVSEIRYENIIMSLVNASNEAVQLERRGDGIYSIDSSNIPGRFSVRRTRDGVQQDMAFVNAEAYSGNLGGVDLRIGKFDDGSKISHNLEVFFTNSRGYPVMVMLFPNILVSDQLVLTQDFFYENNRLSSIVTKRCGDLVSVESGPQYAANALILGEEVFEYSDDEIVGTYYYDNPYVIGSRNRSQLREKRFYNADFHLKRVEEYFRPEETPGWTWERRYSGASFTGYSGSVSRNTNIYYSRGEATGRSVSSLFSDAEASVQQLYQGRDREAQWVTIITYLNEADINSFGEREIEIADASHIPLYRRSFDSEGNTVMFLTYEYYDNGLLRMYREYWGMEETPDNLRRTRSYEYYENGEIKKETIDSGGGEPIVYTY